MQELFDKLPLAQIQTVALALALAAGIYLMLRFLLRYLRKLPPVSRYPRLTHLTISLFTAVAFFWGVGAPDTNIFYSSLLAIVLIFAGYLIVVTFEYLLFDRIFEKGKTVTTPGLLRDVLRMVILLLVVFTVISAVFNFDLSTVLVSSAVMTAVLGLALQDLLGSVLAGVALHIEKPFNVGDWVEVAGSDGEVVSISWRATRIRTLFNNYVVIPNNSIAQAEIINYSQPDPRLARFLNVGTSYNDPPNKVKKAILDVAGQVPGIIKHPKAVVRTIEYSDFSINYRCRYYINDYSKHLQIGDDFTSRLWYKFKREGIEIPFPIRTIRSMERAERNKAVELESEKLEVLDYIKSLPLFSVLSDEELGILAVNSPLYSFGVEEDVITQGDMGTSMFVIVSGEVKVLVRNKDGIETELVQLGAGNAFGEMSLFTGENRNATIRCLTDAELVEITKDDFKDILLKNPSLVKEIAENFEIRSKEINQKLEEVADQKQAELRKKPSTEGLLQKIKGFFEL
ncbi:MAG: mechanosensitive ion channel [candidate division Zixibacteria bacterium]|nr:mechanosensitive ion channel [candidate division Zixibacteria bacterium]